MKTIIIIFLSITFGSSVLIAKKHAGEDFMIGLTGSYMKTLHSRDYRLNSEPGRSFKDGEGDGYNFGAIAKIGITDYPVAVEFVSRVIFENQNLSGWFNGDSIKMLVDDGKGLLKSIMWPVTNNSSGNFDYLTLDLLFNVKLWDFPVGLTAGPSFGRIIYNNYRETFDVQNKGTQLFKSDVDFLKKGYKYSNNNTTIITYDGKLSDESKLRSCLKFGIYAVTEVSSSTKITMRILYSYPLNSLTSAKYLGVIRSNLPDWKISSIELAFEILTGI